MWLQTKRTPEVRAVANIKNSAVIAALTTLLRWPDRLQAKCYIEGFRIVGPIESSCIFKPLSVVEDPVPIEAQEGFHGEQAKADLYTHLRSRPPQHHEKILEATIVEQQRGWLGPLQTANDLNREFGAGMWRFIPRFLLQQRLRDRLIDNAKTGKQNRFTQCPETIFSITLDWLGIALKCFEAVFVERCPECLELPFPEWFDPGISLDDLPDAFKGCPVHPADQRACIVAVWSEHSGKWLFAKSYPCLFGIGSVVVSFNRLPALATAVSKRFGLCMCAAYFDDLITLESVNFRASARPFLLLVLKALAAPPSPAKSIPLGQHRAWLGAALNLATVKDGMYFTLKSSRAVNWLLLVVRSLLQRHLLSVDRQVGLLHYRLDDLGGSECVFSKKDNINRFLHPLPSMNRMFKR